MADQFSSWDRFSAHQALTQDPHKALRWTRYEQWKEGRRQEKLRQQADLLAAQSAANWELGKASKTTT